jgi:hypothetical protein
VGVRAPGGQLPAPGLPPTPSRHRGSCRWC